MTTGPRGAYCPTCSCWMTWSIEPGIPWWHMRHPESRCTEKTCRCHQFPTGSTVALMKAGIVAPVKGGA